MVCVPSFISKKDVDYLDEDQIIEGLDISDVYITGTEAYMLPGTRAVNRRVMTLAEYLPEYLKEYKPDLYKKYRILM